MASTRTPASWSFRAYALPSSRSGSKPAVTTSAGATPASEDARSGETRQSAASPVPVRIVESNKGIPQLLPTIAAAVLSPLGTAALVLLLAIFMLLQREDLRGRIIRLIGQGRGVDGKQDDVVALPLELRGQRVAFGFLEIGDEDLAAARDQRDNACDG